MYQANDLDVSRIKPMTTPIVAGRKLRDASRLREKQLKGWVRRRKIESTNPEWADLAATWTNALSG